LTDKKAGAPETADTEATNSTKGGNKEDGNKQEAKSTPAKPAEDPQPEMPPTNEANAVIDTIENAEKPDTDPDEQATREMRTAAPEMQSTAAPPIPSPGSGKGPGWLALIFSIVALCGAGYSWFQTSVNAQREDDRQTLRLDNLEQAFSDINSSQSGVQSGVNDQIFQLLQRMAGIENGTADQVSQVRQLVSSTESEIVAQISEFKKLILNSESSLGEQIRTIRAEARDYREKIDSEVASAASAKESLDAQYTGFRQQFDTLAGSVNALKQEPGSSIEGWGMLEIEHLMVLANQRLQLGRDPVSALNALKIADHQLRKLDSPALLTTRQAINTEIVALSGIQQVDFATVSSKLTLLSNTLSNLPVTGRSSTVAPVKPAATGENTVQPASTGDKLVNVGRTFLQDLGSLVQVQKGGKSIVPGITPEIEQMILAKGQLMLEGAQLALIQLNAGLFTERIDATVSWVRERYDSDNSFVTDWVSELESLKSMAPVSDLPDISGSLTELRGVIAKEA